MIIPAQFKVNILLQKPRPEEGVVWTNVRAPCRLSCRPHYHFWLMFGTGNKEKRLQREAFAAFWMQEIATLPIRNMTCSAGRRASATDAQERECIVITCMDERNTHVDEALGFAPGKAETYASDGGAIDLATFAALFGKRIDTASAWGQWGRPVSVFLVPHECSNDASRGCHEFQNDANAQKAFFGSLKREIKNRFPSAAVHVMALCTTTHKLREIDVDEADDVLPSVREANAKLDLRAEDAARAGHGIYVGDAYRAWVPSRNTYFRLSAFNPALASNAAVALSMMERHGDVASTEKPVMVHVDYPRHMERSKTDAARANIDAALMEFLSQPAVAESLNRGALKVVKTETDMTSWKGKLLE